MAAGTTSLRSLKLSFLHHHQYHHHSYDFISFKPSTNTSKLFSNLSSSSSSITTTSSSSSPLTPSDPSPSSTSLELLAAHLSSADYRQADEETRRLLIALAGETAQKRGYVFFSEVQFIAAADFHAIDQLWRQHSGGRFGYSVQRRIWKEKCRRDFTRFFIRVGWMKRLDTEVEQYNYRAFPDEFIWELKDDAPEGHLPLTNALRGTQLLMSILMHPAFAYEDSSSAAEELQEEEEAQKSNIGEDRAGKAMGPKKIFKPDYSF